MRSEFSDLVAECKELLAGVGKILESKAVKIIEDPKSEPEFDDEPGSEIIARLVSMKEEIFSRSTYVGELPIETLVDLLAEPSLELIPSLTVMMASLFLRLPDEYDPLQILLQESFTGG